MQYIATCFQNHDFAFAAIMATSKTPDRACSVVFPILYSYSLSSINILLVAFALAPAANERPD